jgi:hypothetical protein
MWTDAGADAVRCSGSGDPGEPAPPLPDGYPEGRALCPTCLRFVPLDAAGHLIKHDTTDEGESDAETRRRGEWFNTHGW